MEDDDFTVDQEGGLDLGYRGWIEIDTITFTLAVQIVTLDLSFNQLKCLPEEVGLLKKMKRFNCACNAIEFVPRSIGRLRQLEELKLNGNRLAQLPVEIGYCRRLSKMYLNENRLEELPDSIGDCVSLTILHLQNNKLKSLPLTLAKLKDSLRVINLANNNELAIIPVKVHEAYEVIIWIVVFLYDKNKMIDAIRATKFELSTLAKMNREIIEECRHRMNSLDEEKGRFLEERDSIKMFIIFRDFHRKSKKKMNKMKEFCKKMIARDSTISIHDVNGDISPDS